MSESPKIPFYGRKPTKRTTTGCLTCRQRRVKCDEAKPSCARCSRGELQCVYGVQLRWPMDGARQGNNRARRTKVVGGSKKRSCSPACSSPSPSLASSSWSSFGGGDGHSSYRAATTPHYQQSPPPANAAVTMWSPPDSEVSDVAAVELGPASPSTCSPPDSGYRNGEEWSLLVRDGSSDKQHVSVLSAMSLHCAYPLHEMQSEDKMLFEFYSCRMCPRCMVRNGYNNNYRQVVLPLVYESPLLLKAVLAVAAGSVKLRHGRYQTAALRYQTAALRGLQQSLTRKKQTSFSRLETLGIILMLCFFEVCVPDQGLSDASGAPIRAWRAHSRGVRNLLDQDIDPGKSNNPHYERAILSFLAQYFASRSVLTYTTMSRHEDEQSMLDDATYWLAWSDRPSTEINPFAGCSTELLRLILAITCQLRRQNSGCGSDRYAEKEWIDEMESRIQSLTQYAPSGNCSFPLPSGVGDQDIMGGATGSVERTAEASRLAALILLEDTRKGSETERDGKIERYVEKMTEIIEAGVSIPRCGKLGSSSYLWSHFIAGCHMQSPRQQSVMLNHLTKLVSGSDGELRTRNYRAEQIQHGLVHVWIMRRTRPNTLAASVEENGVGRFVWESDVLPNNYVLEWV